ncbi:rod-binding protein [Niveispirillum sp. BGYR6]|uniref:rod-binding protein n=1 Tax=Niveispirillum sp. BGYR6 TaxID=2971249 RepID=UPI0022B94043|nr:rod-binding protein [Niveispirillum sp. BGYR6]MDG5496334.1 rod-binding protein [Niveispirillum sp. BGYR6]
MLDAVTAPLPAATPPATPPAAAGVDKVNSVAREFEAMMLNQALQSMFEGVSTEGAFGGGYAEEVYRGMMLDAVARSIADGGGLGIAPQVAAQIDAYNKSKES